MPRTKRSFVELPADYQQGCLRLKKQYKDVLMAAKLSVDEITWNKLNLMECHLIIHAYHQCFETKFSKLAVLNPNDKNVQTVILCKLQLLADTILRVKRHGNIK